MQSYFDCTPFTTIIWSIVLLSNCARSLLLNFNFNYQHGRAMHMLLNPYCLSVVKLISALMQLDFASPQRVSSVSMEHILTLSECEQSLVNSTLFLLKTPSLAYFFCKIPYSLWSLVSWNLKRTGLLLIKFDLLIVRDTTERNITIIIIIIFALTRL